VIKKRIVRGAIALTAVLVPVAGFTAVIAGPVAAVTPKGIVYTKLSITCTKLSGSSNTSNGVTNTKLSGCTGNTGGSGKSKSNGTRMAPFRSDQPTSVTYKWSNGKTTSFTVSYSAGSGCTQPGAMTVVESGSVTADTTKSTSVGAAVTATVCAYPSPTNPDVIKLSLLTGTKFVFGA
jgi:hypothetical protein